MVRVILTPNRRLAIHLRGVSLQAWLEAQYAALCLSDARLPVRLSFHEAAIIWERIIAQSDIGKSLLKVSSAACLAEEAWQLLVQWRLPAVETFFQSEDHAAFSEWANDYRTLCQKSHWVDSVTFIDQLMEAIAQKKLDLPTDITLVGFEELTPQIALFFEKVKAAGVRVQSKSLVSKIGQLSRVSAVDTETELKYAFLKAKKWLNQNPEARIGIVVPALAEQRALVVRTLEAFFEPGFFNVAAPPSLKSYPMIDSALLVLRFFMTISLEDFSRFLRSPFFYQASAEQNIRAALDLKIRYFAETTFTLESIIKRIEVSIKKESKLANFTGVSRLQQLVAMRSQMRGKQRASFWRDRFLDILKCVGWPGDRLLTSEELSISEQLHKVLTEYAAMQAVLGEHSYFEAVSHLQRLLQNTVYAPSSTTSTTGKAHSDAPIQVLGVLEALGMPFDYLWVTGLHREAWPPEPAPNPLIPLKLQRQYDLPRSSAARELKIAQQLTERLSQGGKEVVFSYPSILEERVVSCSALVAHIPEISVENVENLEKVEVSGLLENRDVLDQAPFVGLTEKIKGGAQILKLQALCPFRAFAETRLQAKPIPVRDLGLTAAERGEIIHQVLDYFWQGLHDQKALLAMSEAVLACRIEAAVNRILSDWQLRYPRTLTPQYLKLEKKRTVELVSRFIALEKTRPFFEVVSTEKKRVVNIEGLEIKIRIDRIDRLENQSKILLDYKTGEVSMSHWFGKRPKDPQLPLYCMSEEPRLAGIAVGVIRPDAAKYQGLAAEIDALPGIKTPEKAAALGCAANFREQCEVWETAVRSLAREFMQGVSRVAPIDGDNTCRTCSLKPLCRVHAKDV